MYILLWFYSVISLIVVIGKFKQITTKIKKPRKKQKTIDITCESLLLFQSIFIIIYLIFYT